MTCFGHWIRNAVKCTGPWARHNSDRHGLSLGAAGPGCAEHVEMLARKIAGAGADAMVVEQARSVAEAQLNLTQIRPTRASLIQRMADFGVLDTPERGTSRDFKRILKSIVRGVHVIYLSLQRQACLHRNQTAQPKP
jgi:hypothetical protein